MQWQDSEPAYRDGRSSSPHSSDSEMLAGLQEEVMVSLALCYARIAEYYAGLGESILRRVCQDMPHSNDNMPHRWRGLN